MATAEKEIPTVSEVRRPDLASFGMLFLLGLAFGMMFMFNRLATTNGVPFIPYVFWQALGGTLILVFACAGGRQFPSLSPTYLKVYFLTGVFNISLPYSILSFVAPKVPAGVLSLGVILVPLMIYALALALGMDRFRWVRLAGLVLGFAGVLLVLLPKASLPSPDLAGWVALGLLAPLSWALTAILMAWFKPAAKSLPLACGLMLASTITMVPVMIVARSWWFFDGPFLIGHWAVIGAIATDAAIVVLMFEIIKRAGPVFFSTSNYIAPLVGVGLGMLLFGDTYSLWIWAALLLMFLGLFCVNSAGSSEKQEKL
jgi:drug/metabolite transporter (DMT)-like permease